MIRKCLLPLFLACTSSAATDAIPKDQPQVIDTDVAIIGGGAAGTYAAVRLREDLSTRVVVIEPRDHLGGHVSTYVVPETSTTLEYGVQSYIRNDAATAFFKRFGIATLPFTAKRNTGIGVDVETGAQLTGYITPSLNTTNEALQRWLEIIAQYAPLVEPGYWDFPKDVPEELLMTVEDFVKLHQLEAALPRIVTISGIGTGGIRDLLVFNLIRSFGPSLTQQVIDNSLFIPAGSNSLVYQRALSLLGTDVLLSSTVQSTKRTPKGHQLLVKQGSKSYLINAKRILYTAPPNPSVLAPFNLDAKQKAVFTQGSVEGEFIGVAKIPCLAENTSVNFIPIAAVPSNHLFLKDYPYTLRLDSTGPSGLGLFRVVFSANYTLSAADLKEVTTAAVQRLKSAGTVSGDCSVAFKALSDHTRSQWYLSRKQLAAGFVTDLYALQGYRGVWWSGYAFAAPYSSTVWAYTDTVVQKLAAKLKKKGDTDE